MIDYRLIGERIKKARIEKKITQKTLAEKVGVSIAFLSRIERGSSQLNLKRLTQICNILDISEGSILNGASEGSDSYLEKDFVELLNKCTDKQKKIIYEIAKTIINN